MTRKMKKQIVARCVECESRIFFNTEPEIGAVTTCRECGTKLEVVELNPIELDWLYEDYDDDEIDNYDEYDY